MFPAFSKLVVKLLVTHIGIRNSVRGMKYQQSQSIAPNQDCLIRLSKEGPREPDQAFLKAVYSALSNLADLLSDD
jgi:hypothetical protein